MGIRCTNLCDERTLSVRRVVARRQGCHEVARHIRSVLVVGVHNRLSGRHQVVQDKRNSRAILSGRTDLIREQRQQPQEQYKIIYYNDLLLALNHNEP